MTQTQNITAIVPMRHQSERVPEKNFRPFAGRPLFYHILNTLLATPEVRAIVVDTDSDIIKALIQKDFPTISVLKRPDFLRSGDIAMNDVLAHTLSQIEGQYFLQTHSTNPLLSAATISRAIQIFLNLPSSFDSLFSVTKVQSRFWNTDGRPINHDPKILLRTQDLEPFFEENSNIFLFQRQVFNKQHNRIGSKPFLFEMDKIEATDIDDELDFQLAEQLFINQHEINP